MTSDVPSPPEDVSVEDIFQTSCVLKWKKPSDDGGMPITSYVIERQDLSLKGKVLFNREFPNVFILHSLNVQPDGTPSEKLPTCCPTDARD